MKKKICFVLIIVVIIIFTRISNVYSALISFQEDEPGESFNSDTKKTEESTETLTYDSKSTKEDKWYNHIGEYVIYFTNPMAGAAKWSSESTKWVVNLIKEEYEKDGKDFSDTTAGKALEGTSEVGDIIADAHKYPTGIVGETFDKNSALRQGDILNNILEDIGKWIIDFFITGFGDLIQATTNTFQTYALNIPGRFPNVMYSENDIKNNDDLNRYINIDEKYYTTRTKYKSKDYAFNLESNAKFPLIVVDGYSLSVGKVATTDINFLSIDKSIHNNNEGFWDIIRNFAVALIRATIYLSAAALITSLIYHGIVVVGNVYQSARKRAEHQEGFNRFIKSVLMLVVSVLIMALIISASQMIIRSILSDTNTNEFPIQVIDKTSGKKFSTNFTGYYRYKCQSNDLGERASSAIIYFIFAICNFLIAIFMILRFLVIIGFSVYGIALSVIYIIKKQDFDGKFLTWGIWYAVVAVVPVIIAIFQKITLEISCSK